ncbi:MAG: DUF1330 domain-containing protein [Jiangellales bacterium]
MSDQPVHVLLTMKVNDPAMLGEYFAQVTPLMGDAGIELLSAGTDTVTMLEGQWEHHRVVLMRAPSREAWFSFYASDAYAPVKPLRQQATESTMALLDAVSFEL